ncbi:MAG: hypothetical protein AAAC47_08660 [Pararhizobium sp.]
MTDTFGDMVNEIVDETRRSMSTTIESLIQDAIANYETERFWFNLTNDTTFSLSASQATYTSADNSMIPRFMDIDRLEVTISTNYTPYMEKKSYNWIRDYNDTNALSQPCYWTYWGEAIHTNLPDGGYTVRLSGLTRLASLSVSSDTNAWVQRGSGKELIKQRAKSLLYSEYLRDDANAGRAAGREQQALQKLNLRTAKLLATGTIEPSL